MSTIRIAVIIPALNEEQAIARVLHTIPRDLAAPEGAGPPPPIPPVEGAERRCAVDVVVVDNGSTDRTAEIAAAHGARVIRELHRGYGAACLAGLASVDETEVVVFLDADFSDDPTLLPELVQPILDGRADLVIGSRMLGGREPGALPLHSRFGNWLAGKILTHLYHQPTTDLGPFRAIRCSALKRLHMRDRGFGWTVEMQAKAARLRLPTIEVAVPYRRRIGRSKITGSVFTSIRAAAAILFTAFRLLRWRPTE